jgi:hypothetical protein
LGFALSFFNEIYRFIRLLMMGDRPSVTASSRKNPPLKNNKELRSINGVPGG